MELHERIYDLRKKAGLSQEELSEQVGVSRQAVGKWEQGQALPDIENLIRLSRVLGVTVDELLGTERSDTPAEGVLSATEVEALLKEQELRAQKREQEREQKARLRDKVDEDMAHLRRNRRFAVAAAVFVLFAVLISVLLVRIHRLNEDIDDLRQKNSMMQSDMSDRISGLEREITSLIKEYASLFSSVEFDVTDYDAGNKEVLVSIAVTPKSVNNDMTVRFTAENRETGEKYEANGKYGDNGYSAVIRLPIGTYEIVASKETDGVSTSEALGTYAANPIGLEGVYSVDGIFAENYKLELMPEVKYRPAGTVVISCEAGRWPARKLKSVTVTLYKNDETVDEIIFDGSKPNYWFESYKVPEGARTVGGNVEEFVAPEEGYLFVGEFDFGEQEVQGIDEFKVSVTAIDAIGLEYFHDELEGQQFTPNGGAGGHRHAGHLSLNYELYT